MLHKNREGDVSIQNDKDLNPENVDFSFISRKF